MSEKKQERVRKRSGELKRVRCRVCRKDINFQWYRNHLEVSHPEEDSSDRREAGQARLFGGVKGKKVVQVEVKEHEEQDENDEDMTMEEMSEAVEVQDKEEEVREVEAGEDDNNEEEEEINMVDIKKVKDVILKSLESEGAQVSFEDCTTEEEKLNKCLLLVSKRLKVKQETTNLVNMLEELKLVEGRGGVEEKVNDTEVRDEDSLIRLARNLEEVMEVEVFKTQEAGKLVVCVLCNTAFKTHQNLHHLKLSLRRHLKLVTHKEKVKESEQAAMTEERWEARNRTIGKTIGGLVYHLLYNGRPDTDLPKLIYRVKMAGGDVGDINHSPILVASLLPDISEVVGMRIKRFMGSTMEATGSLPPCNIMADKATDKRDSRHLIGILTLNPGGTTLFKAYFLGAPLCTRGTGEALTASIVEVVSDFITNNQYRGFTGDGVYLHTGVGDRLDKHFGRRGVFTHDLMHKAALTDTKMRNPDAKDQAPGHKEMFAWLNNLTLTIGASVEFSQDQELSKMRRIYSKRVFMIQV